MLEGWEPCKDLEVIKAFAPKCNPKYQPGMVWVGSKMPSELFQKVLGTFAQFPKMETAYSIYYRLSDRSWHIKVPSQCGAGASVQFEDKGDGVPAGYALIGSIHTHPEMGAFWSGTDMNDQKSKYGLHMVFGLKDGKVAHHKCSIFTPTDKYDQEIWNVVEETDLDADYEAPPEWVEKIRAQDYKPVRQSWVQPLPYDVSGKYRSPGQFMRPRYNVLRPVTYTWDAGSGWHKNDPDVAQPTWEAGTFSYHEPDVNAQEQVSDAVLKARKEFENALDVLVCEADSEYVQELLDSYGFSTMDMETGAIAGDDEDISWEESLDEALAVAAEFADADPNPETRDTMRAILQKYGFVSVHALDEQEEEAPSC
jgi:proteasome lid subunit RPN8/RPN11